MAENFMALAAVLLDSGALAVGGAVLLKTRGETRHATWAGIAAAAFFVAAIAVFVGRPDGQVSLATAGLAGGNSSDTAAPAAPSGHLPCRFVPTHSSATVSTNGDLPTAWTTTELGRPQIRAPRCKEGI